MKITVTVDSPLIDKLSRFLDACLEDESLNDPTVIPVLEQTPPPEPKPAPAATPEENGEQLDLRTRVRNLANQLAVNGRKTDVRQVLEQLKIKNLRDCPEDQLAGVESKLQELSA